MPPPEHAVLLKCWPQAVKDFAVLAHASLGTHVLPEQSISFGHIQQTVSKQHRLMKHLQVLVIDQDACVCYRNIPAFEHALLVRVCQLLITQLQNLLDPTCEPALQSADLKIVLRVVRTILTHFYRQLKTKCGVFVENLLGGVQSDTSDSWDH